MKRLLKKLLPHFFVKEPIPEITNSALVQAIEVLRVCSTTEEAMQMALEMLSKKYQAKRFETFRRLDKAYEKDPNKLWERSGFMHCTQQNYLFRVLLIKSGWLKEDQIAFGYSLVFYVSLHQFLVITLKNGTRVAIDPWNYDFGAEYGKYASGFGVKTLE